VIQYHDIIQSYSSIICTKKIISIESFFFHLFHIMQILYLLLVFFFGCTMTHGDQIKLLYEPNAPDYRLQSNKQSLFDKLAPDPALSTFMDVLTQQEDIFNLLNNTNENSDVFTVFCPVNSAFRNELDVHTRDHLNDFLRNHIVPNAKLDPETLRYTRSPLGTMLDGQPIRVKYHYFSRKTVLNGHATVDTAHPVQAINGIAYKIDHLLRPTK
jgi:uncharacterized surface protein with fasciclin (FAS1) repeats